MNKTQTFVDLLKGAATIGAAKAREAIGEAKEALKLDMGNVLMATYERYLQEGWPEDKAKKMALELAEVQLERKLEESKIRTEEGV
ncbi:MAG: hypothetical protein HYX21_00650 [Candidatus Yanofskybacteria bacterium]|nr:hypothetical protein [Candidatus Yanofskybacteria bacterium]